MRDRAHLIHVTNDHARAAEKQGLWPCVIANSVLAQWHKHAASCVKNSFVFVIKYDVKLQNFSSATY